MYCINRSVIYFWMVFCASAAATHHSMQSEKRSSRLMRCVAFLKYMEQMKHWPRRGGLCETGVFLLIDNICTTQVSQLCSVVSNYHVNSLGAQLNSKECMEKSGKRLCNVLERSFPTLCSALGALLGKTQDQSQGESSLLFLKFGNTKQWSECLQMV